MAKDDLLSPSASPSQLSKRFGVRRVNNLPLYLIGGTIMLFALIMGLVMMERAHPRTSENTPTAEAYDDAMQQAMSIAGNRKGGFVAAADVLQDEDKVTGLVVPIAIPDGMDKPPLPPRLKEQAVADPDADRIYQTKMQLFENAVRSKTSMPLTELQAALPTNHAETLTRLSETQQRVTALQQSTDPTTSFKAQLAQLEIKRGDAASSQRNDLGKFDKKDKSDRWQSDSKVEAPSTPYTLRAGSVIPATLISGINSELPGQIIGQISQNVYDTGTGKHLLLPQGSRLVGTYTSDVSYGQSRVMVAWQRIVFPDGKTLDIGAMPGADGAGYSGFTDQVDNHYLRIFGSAILMSGITAGATLSQNNTNNVYGQQNASSAISEALGQQLGNVTTQMISKNLSISPTLEVRAGFRFNVMAVKDLAIDKAYESFDYTGER